MLQRCYAQIIPDDDNENRRRIDKVIAKMNLAPSRIVVFHFCL